jgi:hypothetical protein
MVNVPLIICGSAGCLWADLEKARNIRALDHAHVGCINETALYYPYFFEYWFSYHSEKFPGLRPYVKGFPRTVSIKQGEEVDELFNIPGFDCSDSGLMATVIGLKMGYTKIVLCGMPIDNSPKFYSPSQEHILGATNIQKIWEKEISLFNGRVRSFSGNTLKMLGEPTEEWILNGGPK